MNSTINWQEVAPIKEIVWASVCCDAPALSPPFEDEEGNAIHVCMDCGKRTMIQPCWGVKIVCPEHGPHMRAIPVELVSYDGQN